MIRFVCRQRRRCRPRLERLEAREVLAATLYVDFGDGLTGLRGLTTNGSDPVTETDFVNIANGPIVSGVGNANLTFTSFETHALAAGLTLDQVTAMRANIMQLVRRNFAPFDVNVVESAATSLQDVQNTLSALGTNDCYVFAMGITADMGTVSTGLGGRAGGSDFNTGLNTRDDSAIVLVNHLFSNGSATATRGETDIAYTVSHEAGHTFGLEHTVNNPSNSSDQRILTNSDILSQFYNVGFSVDQRNIVSFFTRYPLPRAHNPGTYVPYDRLAVNVGLAASGPAYLTGTGAFDEILVTRTDATMAHVVVNAHRNNTVASQISTFSYDVPYANGILIEAGVSEDRITVDAALGVAVTVRGMNGGRDRVILDGAASGSVIYVPGATVLTGLDENSDVRGQVVATGTFGTTTLNLEEFSATGEFLVRGATDLTFRSPGNTDTLTLTSPATGQNQIDGTVNAGRAMVALIFQDVANLVIDTGNGETTGGNDTVNIQAPFTATGLQNVTITTGLGNDEVMSTATSLALPLAGGAFLFDGGTGTDILDDSSATPNVWTISGANMGNFDGQVTFLSVETLQGSTNSDDYLFQAGGSLSGNVEGGSGTDRLDYSAASAVVLSLTAAATTGFSGNDGVGPLGGAFTGIDVVQGSLTGEDQITGLNDNVTWTMTGVNAGQYQRATSVLTFASVERLIGGTLADSFTIPAGAGLTGRIDGAGGTDMLLARGSAAADVMDLVAGQLSLNALDTVFSNLETIQLLGMEGADRFSVSFAKGSPVPTNTISVNGGTGVDNLQTIGTDLADVLALAPALLRVNARAIAFASLEELALFGGNGNDSITALAMSYAAGLGMVRIFGEQGNDLIRVTPSPTTAFFVDGGTHATGLGDGLHFVAQGAVFHKPMLLGANANAGMYRFANRKQVQFAEIESGVGGFLAIRP